CATAEAFGAGSPRASRFYQAKELVRSAAVGHGVRFGHARIRNAGSDRLPLDRRIERIGPLQREVARRAGPSHRDRAAAATTAARTLGDGREGLAAPLTVKPMPAENSA